MDWGQLFIIITGLLGQILVARRNPRGFVFWIMGNIVLIQNFFNLRQFGLAGLYGVYTMISLYSIIAWGRFPPRDS